MKVALAKTIIAVLTGLLVTSQLGVDLSQYLWALVWTAVWILVIGIVPSMAMEIRKVPEKTLSSSLAALASLVSLAVDTHVGFTVHQILWIGGSVVGVQIVLHALLPE